ncbi:UNVERIFIED_CONTAM: hypothetical protein Slati_0192500 [Sesamum latifolium]|uniref:Uncharacterized protein n=1 Tax=Sesamum latifolium TaxID=2727402 RepID=A0AAW2YBH3_9LAMI
MAANNQLFNGRNDNPPRKVNEWKALNKSKLGICTSSGHPTDACPTLQEEPTEHADAIGSFSRGSYQPSPPPPQSNSNSGMPLEDIVKTFALSTQQFQQETRSSIQNLESQISQLASSVSRLESQGELPSQTIINPSAIVLQSGKELPFESGTVRGYAREDRTENSVERGHAQQGKSEIELEIPSKQAKKPDQVSNDTSKVLVIKPPFPKRFAKGKKEKEEKEIFEIVRKVQVNIPLIDAIKQVPRYAKFL